MSWGQIVQIGGNDVTDDVPTKWCFPNELNEIVIGRLDESSSYILNKAYVSAKHLVIRRTCEGDGIEQYVIEDYSSNGTYINGELVGKGKCKNIRNNDQISFKFRGVEKLVFKFMINDSNEESEPPLKCQRIQNKRSHGSLAEIDISASKRINALEREIQQQDLRITNQSTKLESSAREYGNLQTTYLATREALNEKENELTEAKQTRLMLESSLAAMEARCRNLDDSVSNMKTQVPLISCLQSEFIADGSSKGSIASQ
jgi:pSer/pThr/pTyr-binding forkhead associated (FHA) protein